MEGTTIKPFTEFTYKTTDGQTITATKNNGVVTLVSDKNGVRQLPIEDFWKEFYATVPKLERTPETDVVNFQGKIKPENPENKPKNRKGLLLGLGALVVAVSAYILTRGKVKTKNLNNTFEKFEHGIAMTTGGCRYTGTVTKVSKDGTKYELKYVDGKLTESIKNGKLWKKYETDSTTLDQTLHIVDTYLEDGYIKRVSIMKDDKISKSGSVIIHPSGKTRVDFYDKFKVGDNPSYPARTIIKYPNRNAEYYVRVVDPNTNMWYLEEVEKF